MLIIVYTYFISYCPNYLVRVVYVLTSNLFSSWSDPEVSVSTKSYAWKDFNFLEREQFIILYYCCGWLYLFLIRFTILSHTNLKHNPIIVNVIATAKAYKNESKTLYCVGSSIFGFKGSIVMNCVWILE